MPEYIGKHREQLKELNQFYALRAYEPAWIKPTPNILDLMNKSLNSLINFAEMQGIQLDNYPIETLQQEINNLKPETYSKVDIAFTDFIFFIAHALHGDTVKIPPVYQGWNFEREAYDFAASLADAVSARTVGPMLMSLTPKNQDYLDLIDILKTYTEYEKNGAWAIIPAGPTLKMGANNGRVISVRQRLAAEGYELAVTQGPSAQIFDEDLKNIVMEYQRRNGQLPDGNIGTQTLKSLNVPLSFRIDQIKANLERWRHLPLQFPARYATVNIADGHLVVWEGKIKIHQNTVVVGKLDRKTPFINSKIRSVLFNPSWHVPLKIAQQDILPKLRKDPHYLEKLGFLIDGHTADANTLSIDWNEVKQSQFNYKLRQAPGVMNSLGRIKFDFENNFAVYLHGTPHEELFVKPNRFFSSGCVRLQDPEEFAEVVLQFNKGNWTTQKVQAEIDKNETKWLKVSEPLPLYILYWTVFKEQNGKAQFRFDSYDYDTALIKNFKKSK